MMISMVSMTGLAKKSKMDPQLLEKISQELLGSRFGVTVIEGISAHPNNPCIQVIKDAGAGEITWDQLPGAKYCGTRMKKGVMVHINEVKIKKWGLRIDFRTAEAKKIPATKTYWDKIKQDGREIEIERTKNITKTAYDYFRLDFKFNEKLHADTPENIRHIQDIFSQAFIFFKTKEEAMVYVDTEFGSDNSIETGLTVAEVIGRLGLPVKKISFKNRMVYKYQDWILTFEDGKVVDVKF